MGIFDWLFKGDNKDIEKYEKRKQRLKETRQNQGQVKLEREELSIDEFSTSLEQKSAEELKELYIELEELKKTKSKKNKNKIFISAQNPWGKGDFHSHSIRKDLKNNSDVYDWTEDELYLFYTLVMDLAYAATEEELISIESGERQRMVMDMLEKNPEASGLLKMVKDSKGSGGVGWFGIHNIGLHTTIKYWFNNDNIALEDITDALKGFNLNLSKSKVEEFEKRRGRRLGVKALTEIELNHLKIVEKLSIQQRDNLINGLICFGLIANNGITARSAGGIMQIGKKLNVDYDRLNEFFIETLEIPENVFKEFEHSLNNI